MGRLPSSLVLLTALFLVLDKAPAEQESTNEVPWALTTRVQALMRQSSAESLDALRSIVRELRSQVLREDDDSGASDDEAYAFLLGAVHLAERSGEVGVETPSPRALFEEARRVAAERHGWSEQIEWVQLHLAQHVYAAEGRAAESAAILRAQLSVQPASANELSLRRTLVEMLRKQALFDDALAEIEAWGALLDERRVGLEDDWPKELAAHRGTHGQVLRQLGLPGEARKLYAEEGAAAALAQDVETFARHALHQTDLDLFTERFDAVLAMVTEARAAEWFGKLPVGTQDIFALTEGVALSELEREQSELPRRAASVLAEVLARGNLAQHDALAAELNLADLALRERELGVAESRLNDSRARFEGFRTTAFLNEAPWLVAHESRLVLARHEEAPGSVQANELEATREKMRAAWSGLLAQWAETPYRSGGIGFLNVANRREALGTLVRCCIAADGAEQGARSAFEHLLEAEALGSTARLLGSPATTIEALRARLLAPGGGALIYLPSKERTHLFVLDRQDLQHVELLSKDELQGAARELVGLLARRPGRLRTDESRAQHRAKIEAAAERMGKLFLPQDVRTTALGWVGVTVSGLELVGAPPLELVLLAPGRRLGWTHAIDRLPSFALGQVLADRPRPRADDDPVVALVGDLDPRGSDPLTAGLERIGFGAETAEQLLGAWPTERTRVVVGPQATAAALARPDVAGAAVLELWLHGVFDSSLERGAALVLEAEDGEGSSLLTCAEVEGALDVRGLVVLAACGSALGPVRFGDDALAHLGGAFLRAGARAVVTSRAPLDFEATRALLTRFHAHLATGLSPAEALRHARADRDGSEGDALAFYLAQLEVTGLGHATVWE